jgi:protein-S-isoprenylcysteine O-methyltransferase Ste14
MDQLVEVFMNREGLVEDARLAIESVVKERGIDVNAEVEEIENEQRAINAAKKNSPSRWLIALHCFAIILAAPLARFIKTDAVITDGLLILVAGALGWWLSTRVVKSVYKLGIKKPKRTLILSLLPFAYIGLWLAIIAMIVNLK